MVCSGDFERGLFCLDWLLVDHVVASGMDGVIDLDFSRMYRTSLEDVADTFFVVFFFTFSLSGEYDGVAGFSHGSKLLSRSGCRLITDS